MDINNTAGWPQASVPCVCVERYTVVSWEVLLPTTMTVVHYCRVRGTRSRTGQCRPARTTSRWSSILAAGTTSPSSASSATATASTPASSVRSRTPSSRRTAGRTPTWQRCSTGRTSSTCSCSCRSPGSWRRTDCAPRVFSASASSCSGRACVASTSRRRRATGPCSSARR